MPKRKILFLLSLAAVPIQLGKFFFPSYSYILGIPIDYRAQNLYFSDIVIISYLIASISGIFQSGGKVSSDFKKFWQDRSFYLLTLGAFLAYLLVDSVFFSVSKAASLYFFVKILEFGLFSVFAAYDFSDKKIKKIVPNIISVSLVVESLIVLLQFLNQKSLGLWILGERTFNTTTPDIAHFELFGYQLLRPYGTFPHPNVLGAFLVIYTIILVTVKPNKPTLFTSLAATVITFSKGAILTSITAFIIMSKNLKDFFLKSILFLVVSLLLLKIASTTQVASVAERLTLIQAALDMSLKNLLLGVGSNNFILELSKLDLTSISQIRLLQPVHNVFLLILVENGLIGLALLSLMLFAVAQKAAGKGKTALFIAVLIFASVDHFLWTLEQGLLLFWLSLSYILSTQKEFAS